MINDIKEKKIFITGSTGGIGSSICRKFIENNCTLLLTSSSQEKLINLEKQYGSKHSYYHLDLANIDTLENKMKFISKENKDIDVIINNAGITDDALILRMNNSQWSNVINTNLNGTYNCCKIAAKYMVKQRSGKIINIS